METTEHGKVGRFVYGAVRLDFALSSLTAWMGEGIDGQHATGGAEISATYFRKHQTPAGVQQKFHRCSDVIARLLKQSTTLEGRPGGDWLSEVTATVSDTHGMLADIFEDLQYPGIPAQFLRARQT
ncbi:hypothetical protein CR105_05295 [Massilia eurypsychrophila]|uniref:Uncharacterized protein n=1 Tax=Massilia eurypsychrophila TaxID=1485217 RepID=A0A2G8TKA4_9BURK|nr:hypothetical protein [Massilia eurypsychrophila]PIL46480.1 hypothetical protein CR105_05295 [Massilia eurypsychrophila]